MHKLVISNGLWVSRNKTHNLTHTINNQQGFAPILLLLFSLLIIGFITFANYIPIKDTFLENLFRKSEPKASETFSPKVLVVIYNPILESQNNKTLIEYKNYYNPDTISQNLVTEIATASSGIVNYQIADRVELDKIPVKKDGFQYTDQTYLDCLNNDSLCHKDPYVSEKDIANYVTLLNDINACDRFNNGEFDEIWLWGGPWFGFYESNLAGNGAYSLNSFPTTGTTCQKPLPIMGFNYQVEEAYALHSFGHRTEDTMKKVYGGNSQNSISTSFNKFWMNDYLSPNYQVSGCGSIHYPPNATREYEYDNQNSVNSFCDDFFDYPKTGDINQEARPVTCQIWNCNQLGFMKWWLSHLPKNDGTGPDGKLNNWWKYFANPNLANGSFSNFSAASSANSAQFSFSYSNTNTSDFIVDLSTTADMSSDVYLNFGQGFSSPITVTNPTKWDKYSCGKTLYWRVLTLDRSVQSPIQTLNVCQNPTPTPEIPRYCSKGEPCQQGYICKQVQCIKAPCEARCVPDPSYTPSPSPSTSPTFSPTPSPTQSPSPIPTTNVRSVKITYPNGGETLTKGDTVTVTWQSYDVDFCTLRYDSGSSKLLGDINPASIGQYSWNITGTFQTTIQAKMNIICYKVGVESVTDQSDDFFTINPSPSPSISTTPIPSANSSQEASSLKGDFNNDGKVNILDFSVFLNYWRTGNKTGDLNGDGRINVADLSTLLSNFGKSK